MIQSKAIDILRGLSRKEFLQFGKYLESPAFVSNRSLPKLYKFIKPYHPALYSETITKENIYRTVYGNSGFNDAKTRKLLSDIYKEAERFIVIMNTLSHKEIYDKTLLEEFDKRKLDSMFNSKYEDYNAYLDKSEKTYSYFLEKYQTEWKNVMFYLERGMQHKIALNIYKRSEYLIFLFLSDLFISLNDIESNKQKFNIGSSINLAEAFISCLNDKKLFEFIEQNNIENKDLLYLHYLGYLALRNIDSEKHYNNLKKYALSNFNHLHESLQKATIVYLINYCTRKLKRNNSFKYKLELNKNFKLYLKYKLYKLTGENFIRSDIFITILSNFFAVGKITEAAKFLEDNIESIQPSHRKNMTAIASALLHFERKDFGESLKHASMIKSNTFLYKDKVKLLILKNHYELKNFEIAKELSNNYKSYLTENRHMPDLQKEKGIMFLHYYGILWKIFDEKAIKVTLNGLRKEVGENNRFTESEWIISKIDELINKSK